jgi:hypothetical protein
LPSLRILLEIMNSPSRMGSRLLNDQSTSPLNWTLSLMSCWLIDPSQNQSRRRSANVVQQNTARKDVDADPGPRPSP